MHGHMDVVLLICTVHLLHKYDKNDENMTYST